MSPRLLRNLAMDTGPLRESRDFRLLMVGGVVTGLGAQAALVALLYQVYVISRSAFVTGLIGLVELIPLVAASLWAGALADRMDRRRLLILCQVALVVFATVLAVVSYTGHAAVWNLFVLAGLTAGASAVERVSRSAIVPNTVSPGRLRSALSMSFGLFQLTMVIGPAVGGLMLGWFGPGTVYALDAATCLGMVWAAWEMTAQPPQGARREPFLRSIGQGLGFVRRSQALIGSFVIDICAMTFGMPRALFPVLALTVYDAGPAGTGYLAAAVSAGATVAALTTGWLGSARFLGRITMGAVVVWGLAIAGAGMMSSLGPAAALFAVAGAADSVSAVCRTTIAQSVTPDDMRGRMSSVFSLVVAGGPRLGDVEAGAVAALTTPRISVVSGGLACIASVAVCAVAFPGFVNYDADRLPSLGGSVAAEGAEA